MTMTLLFVLIAFVLLLSFAYLAMRRGRDLPNVDQALTAIRSLDIEAFRNLVDPEEEAFLLKPFTPSQLVEATRALLGR